MTEPSIAALQLQLLNALRMMPPVAKLSPVADPRSPECLLYELMSQLDATSPDWRKVELVPVSPAYAAQQGSSGSVMRTEGAMYSSSLADVAAHLEQVAEYDESEGAQVSAEMFTRAAAILRLHKEPSYLPAPSVIDFTGRTLEMATKLLDKSGLGDDPLADLLRTLTPFVSGDEPTEADWQAACEACDAALVEIGAPVNEEGDEPPPIADGYELVAVAPGVQSLRSIDNGWRSTAIEILTDLRTALSDMAGSSSFERWCAQQVGRINALLGDDIADTTFTGSRGLELICEGCRMAFDPADLDSDNLCPACVTHKEPTDD